MPFLYPLTRPVVDRAYAGLGIGVYDVMGAGRGVPHHLRHLGRKQAPWSRSRRPTARPCKGSIQFYEGQVDDARHTMMIGRTAAHYGAAVATSTRVVGFLRERDRVVGVRVRDLESGREFEIRARQMINAAGVWMDEICRRCSGGRGQFQVRASKGIHLVVPRNRINSRTGLITRTEKSLLFIIPGAVTGSSAPPTPTGTWTGPTRRPARPTSTTCSGRPTRCWPTRLTRDDVVGVYAGLRPLLAGESDSTSKLSREHAVASPVRGVIMIAGGKYTTYRIMAKDAIDAAVRELDRKVPESCTEDVPLLGAEGYHALWNARPLIEAETGLRDVAGRAPAQPVRLAAARTAGADRRATGAGPTRWTVRPEYLKVEAVYAASHEGALHLDDILARRTRISIETWDRGVAAASEVAAAGRPGARLG